MNSRVTIILVIMAIYLAGMLWIGLKGSGVVPCKCSRKIPKNLLN